MYVCNIYITYLIYIIHISKTWWRAHLRMPDEYSNLLKSIYITCLQPRHPRRTSNSLQAANPIAHVLVQFGAGALGKFLGHKFRN